MNIKKGDNVQMMRGKDRGKTGSVLSVSSLEKRIVIEGLNLIKKRARPKAQGKKGEMVSVPRAIDASNVMLVCKNCKVPARIGVRMQGEQKVRYCKKCDANN